jgi:enoyl-CoA hydratase
MECFSKPCVSLIDGMVMGGGVGISLYGTHRVAGEGYRFAMPETMIGLFPDVGTAHVLGRMPGEIGVYLGLTGRSIGRADAFRLGLVTHCIAAAEFETIIAGLEDTQPVDPLLDDRHIDPGGGELDQYAATIASCFSQSAPAAIMDNLSAVTGPHAEWAQAVTTDLSARSPTSLAITLRHIREAKKLDLRETLIVDYRLACRCLDDHDLFEGARAVLIDKDNKPSWRPAAMRDDEDTRVESYFMPLGEAELSLPTRSQMQQSRA